MSDNAQTFDPDYAVPPGETLLETLEHLGLNQKQLAQRMGRPIKTINDIIKGTAAITEETALQLEKVTDVSARFWNNAEANYRERLAKSKKQEAARRHLDWANCFSYAKMVSLRFVPPTKDKEQRVRNLLKFFEVASSAEWESAYSKLQGAAREANNTQSELGDFSAWLRAGEIKARNVSCSPYSAKTFTANLVEIRALTRENPIVAWPEVVRLCADAGVALVFVPELKKIRVHGFTRWFTKKKAIIQLSLRYKTDDMLWFSFFHEAAYILLHDKQDIFVRDVDNPKEQEADEWAANFLIPPQEWTVFLTSLPPSPTSAIIKRFASQTGVANGIVLGRLQHREKRVGAGQFNHLKHKVEIKWKGLEGLG
ncbi:MAG: hypothetical protein M2R45_03599 [Verrucomicrobia subdivision 3 bacterium]|nr:hypothetical protein [Limisphaerales bacterium]MCS1414769.1 hypothetical protein [Limisphaerales bacterium]